MTQTVNLAKVESMASALYDGGWRASDREEIANVYGYAIESYELDAICDFLKKYSII